MCFYHGDADWTAEVWDEDDGPAARPVRCDECGLLIPAGGWRRHVDAQEHEEFHNDEHDFDKGGECEDGCSFGESFFYDRCEKCHRVIEIIRKVEESKECKGEESMPPLTKLSDSLHGADDVFEYAAAIPPDLVEHWNMIAPDEAEIGPHAGILHGEQPHVGYAEP
jgi:hypothetical protein